MYDFTSHLKENEKILWQGQAHPKKGGKPIGGLVFALVFVICCIASLILSLVFGIGDGAKGLSLDFIVIFLGFFFLLGIIVYSLVYFIFLKHKLVADDFYCLTNLRAMKYESKKDKLCFGYLKTLEDIHTENKKDGFGDLYFSANLNKGGEPSDEDLKALKDAFLHPDPENMLTMSFESIENPTAVKKLALEARSSKN
ncbi:hypothetical protein IKG45_01670 [Candidatus Saccharibacteria bacterium]|nr:hypothetical protein [Candidatus Saccharibacteria bacterium]